MPGASTTRSLSALRLWAGRVEIISHSKCSWKHLDIQLSIYFKCVLCLLQTLLICLICFLTGNQKCLCRRATDSQLYIKNTNVLQREKKTHQDSFSLFPLKETYILTTAYLIADMNTVFHKIKEKNHGKVKRNKQFYNQSTRLGLHMCWYRFLTPEFVHKYGSTGIVQHIWVYQDVQHYVNTDIIEMHICPSVQCDFPLRIFASFAHNRVKILCIPRSTHLIY